MNFNNMQNWTYFALIGGGILLLGIIVYFLPIGKMKIPAVITTAFAALGAGVAVGVVFMAGFGYKPMSPPPEPTGAQGPLPKAVGGPMPKGKAGMGGGGAAPKGKGGFGGGTPSSKVQLASLVSALDKIVDKPVALTLTPDDRAAIAKHLEGLESANEIKEDDAKARLDAIQKILEKDKQALETVGYRWPGEPRAGGRGGFGKEPPANPFKQGTGAERLKSLMERLTKK